MKPRCKGRPGVARALAENPDVTRDIYAERCVCGAAPAEAGQEVAWAWDYIGLPPIKPITTRINLFRATCPCCKAHVIARAPADMPDEVGSVSLTFFNAWGSRTIFQLAELPALQ
jgi:transposase